MKPLVAAVAVLVTLAVGAQAQTSEAESFDALRAQAEQGDATAQLFLGITYSEGRGVPQDDAEAARWYRLAAEQGNTGAQISLGFKYLYGTGVPQDDVQAHMWFNLAASRRSGNTPVSNDFREDAVRHRDLLADRMTPDDRSEAQRLAREWDAAHPREP